MCSSQSSGAVLPPDRALPQGHAPPGRLVRQNQRRVGDPAGVAAAHQTSGQRAVWRGLDGYVLLAMVGHHRVKPTICIFVLIDKG